uniref:Uncharacterized protein n=1 Tax=Rhodnius prolixus TaxID=13249 RepID=T1HSY6_RHOPR
MAQESSEGKRHASSNTEVGQEKIVRAFAEIMKNMTRMKTCVRPAMCKPYGKQSESLQKTLMDTIQLVQSLRSILPPPHIAVSSWKNEDKHKKTAAAAAAAAAAAVGSLDELCETVTQQDSCTGGAQSASSHQSAAMSPSPVTAVPPTLQQRTAVSLSLQQQPPPPQEHYYTGVQDFSN